MRAASTRVVRALAHHLKNEVPIIGVGGILSGDDAREKIAAGASLVQLYSGLIYRGPGAGARMRAAPRMMGMRVDLPAFVAALLMQAAAHAAPPEPVVTLFPQPALSADQLGVIVNDDDPDSVAIAAYYMQKRDIPAANLIHVRFKPGAARLRARNSSTSSAASTARRPNPSRPTR